jgi:hypothetical protein
MFALGMVAAAAVSCKGPDVFSCEDYQELLDETVATRGILQAFVPEVPPYHMVIAFSEPAVNELLGAALGTSNGGGPNLGITEEIGPLKVDFQPIVDPEITLASPAACDGDACIQIFMKYNVDVIFGDGGVGNGIGDFLLGVPLSIERSGDVSFLIADFTNVKLDPDDFHMTLNGINLTDFVAVRDFLLETVILRQMRTGIGVTRLIEMVPWTIGSEDVVLAARAVFVNSEEHTMVIGATTNLKMPVGAALPTTVALDGDKKMEVHLHEEVLEKMSQRLIEEGSIARRYNDDGAADPEGNTWVTIEQMNTNKSASASVETDFRIWRTDDKYCGYVDVSMPLILELENEQVGVRPGDLKIVDGVGVGVLATTNDEFVEQNKDLVDEFKTSLAEQVGLTINYREFRLPGSVLIFSSEDVAASDDGVEITLGFKIVSSS